MPNLFPGWPASTAVFSSVRTSACSGMRTAYGTRNRKQRTYVDTNSGFVHGYIHSPRVLDFWWNGEIRLRGLQTARIRAGKEARPAIQPCDTLATLPSELFTLEVSHHWGARSSSGHAAHNGPIDLVVSKGRVPFEKLWTKSHIVWPFLQSYTSIKKLQKKNKKKQTNDVIVNGSQRCERRATCTSSSGLLQY